MTKKVTENKTKKEWIIAFIVAAVILLGAGAILCVNFMINPSKIIVSEDQGSIVVKNGQEFTIELSSNATTGYSWSLDNTYDSNIVTSVGNEYIASNSNLSGAGGKEQWTFKAAGSGSTTLNFVYSRSWEGAASQINSKTFTVTVE